MSTQITGHEPAMPVIEPARLTGIYYGLTIRQYYTGLAMQGLWQSITDQSYDKYEVIAEMSVKQADALIAELNKTYDR